VLPGDFTNRLPKVNINFSLILYSRTSDFAVSSGQRGVFY
jgi:hypothetical protein